MRILSFKPNHDGTAAHIENGVLKFSIEAEKDSGPRYAYLRNQSILEALALSGVPDVIVNSGWYSDSLGCQKWDAGYFGIANEARTGSIRIFGKEIATFSSTHERSHIACALGLSDLDPQAPCYALTYEGRIGTFYKVENLGKITKLASPMESPGSKYEYLYHLLDSSQHTGHESFSAGKLMALASYGDAAALLKAEVDAVSAILETVTCKDRPPKEHVSFRSLINLGFDSKVSRSAARFLSDSIFSYFYRYAELNLSERLPLLISGGCGLNCNWNAEWRRSGLFESVWVPPVCNDSGSAIGSAIEAQFMFTGKTSIDWSVFSGHGFVHDIEVGQLYKGSPIDYDHLAYLIAEGVVIPWVEGRYEMGPRALGHRSLLADPTSGASKDRLNEIKKRESYRPIAPVCLEGHEEDFFEVLGTHRYMLYNVRVHSGRLPAVTHVDGSSRLQVARRSDSPLLSKLLESMMRIQRPPVLCNTSLNFNGRGFINRMKDLVCFANTHRLRHFVVDGTLYTATNKE